MWNAAAAVEGVKRGVPSASRPAFSGCWASTSFRRGKPRGRAGEGGVGGRPPRPGEDPRLMRVAGDAPLVDLRGVVLPDEEGGDADGAVQRVDAVLDLLHQLGRVLAAVDDRSSPCSDRHGSRAKYGHAAHAATPCGV